MHLIIMQSTESQMVVLVSTSRGSQVKVGKDLYFVLKKTAVFKELCTCNLFLVSAFVVAV